jgi:hypothetical protein
VIVSAIRNFHDSIALTVYESMVESRSMSPASAVPRASAVIVATHQIYVIAVCLAINPDALLWLTENKIVLAGIWRMCTVWRDDTRRE